MLPSVDTRGGGCIAGGADGVNGVNGTGNSDTSDGGPNGGGNTGSGSGGDNLIRPSSIQNDHNNNSSTGFSSMLMQTLCTPQPSALWPSDHFIVTVNLAY